MKKYLILIALLVVLAGCGSNVMIEEQPEMPSQGMPALEGNEGPEMEIEYVDVSPAEAKELIETVPELVVIDVSPNYANGHIPGAINYYVGDGSLDRAIPSLDREGIYLVYCHVDSAAILGAQKLVDAGFKNVYRLEGNYRAWVDAGYPIEK